MTNQNQNQNQNTQPTGDDGKLYAGKFKTVEDLEAAYKTSFPTFQENEELKKRVSELSTVPHDYINPSDVAVEETRMADIKMRAKEAGLTQAQYEKFLRSDKARLDARKENFEKAKKDVSEETMNILKDYVNKHYPKELSENMLNTFIGNKEARQAALAHRDQLLNNRVPGIDKTPPASGYRISDEDIKKAYAAKEKSPGDMKARQHYINLVAAQAEQRAS